MNPQQPTSWQGSVMTWLYTCLPHHRHEEIMTKLSELAGQLDGLHAQLSKAKNEIMARIEELQEALSNVELTPEAEQALTNLTSASQSLDDIVTDATP